MKKFKSITIYCNDETTALMELVKIEEACVLPEFKYDEQVEQMYEPDDRMAHILVELPGVPQAILLAWVNDGKIKVINIVPFNHSAFRIEIEDYNRIIDEFYNKIVLPSIDNRHHIEITSGEYTLQEVIPKSFESLNIWAACPGAPNAPFSHQLDLELWFEFLCQMIKNGEEMSSGQLEQWLAEEKQWSEDVIEETILKYEEELALLGFYVSRYA